MKAVKKVLVITNVPQHYRTSLFNEMNEQLKDKGIELKVVFAAAGYSRRKAKLDFSQMQFDHTILKSLSFALGNIEKTMFTYSGVSRLIRSFQPDKIIVTGYSIATLRLWLLSFIKPVDYIIWSGSILRKGRMDSGMRLWLRRQFIKRAGGFVSYGTLAKEYLISMGAPAEKISIGINTVDTSFYAQETERIRESLPPSTVKHLTYIGYLSERKKVIQLLKVVKLLTQKRNDFVLDLAGDGETIDELKKFVADENLQNHVVFHGFVQKAGLPAMLAKSTCFLFQTGFDIWGLVLNEAMASGVVCLASKNAGATFDLIEDGRSGYAVDFEDTEDVVKKISYLLDNPQVAKEMSLVAQKAIEQKAAISVSARGFISSLAIN